MADLELQILFSGMIAYVPSEDYKNVKVLVLNDFSNGDMPHRPFLLVKEQQLALTDLPFQDGGDDWAQTFIGGGYDLEVEGLMEGGFKYDPCRPAMQSENKDNSHREHSSVEMTSRSVTELKEVSILKASQLRSNAVHVDPDFLNSTNVRIGNTLAVRVRANTGTLGPYQDEENPAKRVGWTDPAKIWQEQLVPNQVEWKVSGLSMDEVTLSLRPFGGGPYRTVRLKPENGRVTVEIRNEPDPLTFCAMGHKRYQAHHLGRLARFSGGQEELETACPALLDDSDKQHIDNLCGSMGHEGGRAPVICYGTQMP